jgi:phosphatidylinositol 3-kinase
VCAARARAFCGAGIADIALEPDKTVSKVHERFHLYVSDEEAVLLMQQLIDASLSAKVAQIVDLMHDWAQALRS